MHAIVSPDFLQRLPRFDVIFLFSVIHRIWATEGRSFAEECLSLCLRRASVIVYEGVVWHDRYTDMGAAPPEFTDGDVEAGMAWHSEWLTRLAPAGCRIDYLGAVQPLNGNPPRIVFVLRP